jgi:para-aminobenzoate synthetase component 1
MDCIRKIKDYIAAGDIYQVNMSQRFETPFAGDPFALFKTLYQKNPAPFFAFVHAGDHVIVSTSPERFITRRENRVETRPIKGTRPRGITPDEDARLRRELAESPKDDAELSMIVDLMRNDIGKVCEGGSVTVREHKRVEAYANVYHLISIVDGVLDPGADAVDLIRATFPGGSITGCPKIRSMEIIDELETRRRHIYTGSIGYIGFHDTLDLSIAIRTATIVNDRLVFSVGGGVVYDSDPEDEYHETLHKGRTLLDTLASSGEDLTCPPRVWIDGGLKPMDQALLPMADPGVQYGHGFFETLRVDAGVVRYLDAHLARLEKAWRAFFPRPFPDVAWDQIIDQVIRACGLSGQCAAVKIMATRGSRSEAPWDDHLMVSARPYTHRLTALGKPGLDLVTWNQPRHSFLADYKSMNYQYYYLAGIEARKAGGDEALILNADGSVSETSTANLLVFRDGKVICPASPHVLEGVMEQAVLDLMGTRGYDVSRHPLFPADLSADDQILLTNSLMGAVPVLTVDGRRVADASALCASLNRALFETA